MFVSTSFNEILHAIPSIDSVLDIVTAPSCIEDHEIDGTEPVLVSKEACANFTYLTVNAQPSFETRKLSILNIRRVSGCNRGSVR